MKVLKESKEELPVSFLTDFISQGWEKVGVLQASIEALKETYKGVGPVTDLIQDLVDAYLVCIGQLETHIEDKKYIEYPEDSNLGSNKLTEDIRGAAKSVAKDRHYDLIIVDSPSERTGLSHSGDDITTDILLKLKS